MTKIWTVERTRDVLALADELEAVAGGPGGGGWCSQTVHDLRRLAHQLGTMPVCGGVTHIDGGTLLVECTRSDYHDYRGGAHRAIINDGDVMIEWPVTAG